MLQADLSDARLVFIDIVDTDGTVVPTDISEVTLTISGPGSIVGPTIITMKGGQLATWVRAGRIAGNITLTARAPGLPPASLTLTSCRLPTSRPSRLTGRAVEPSGWMQTRNHYNHLPNE